MLNIKTGAISLPGMLANLLYKDLATDLGYETYSENASFGPQSVSDFSVSKQEYEDQQAQIGLTGDEARALGHAITDPISTVMGAMTGPIGAVGSLAARATAAQEENDVAKQQEISDKFSDPVSALASFGGLIGGPIGSVVGALSKGYGLAKDISGFLSDLAKDDDTVADQTGFSGFSGFKNDLNDTYADAFSLDGIDIDPVAKAEAISGGSDTSGSSNSSSSSGSTDSSSDRGSSRGMGGATGRGGEDSDEGSAGAGW